MASIISIVLDVTCLNFLRELVVRSYAKKFLRQIVAQLGLVFKYSCQIGHLVLLFNKSYTGTDIFARFLSVNFILVCTGIRMVAASIGQPPLFHDGGKEWSCCKQRSHDFSDFLNLPGCATGKHSSEKPVTKAAPSPNAAKPMQMAKTGDPALDAAKSACGRCRQGFFCSDHGAQKPISKPSPASPAQAPVPKSSEPVKKTLPPKVLDINVKQVCKHKGCGNTFTEKNNHESACSYHPGPAVFHDRQKGWKCCDVHVTEFDEFLEIPPCTKGWHDANPEDAT